MIFFATDKGVPLIVREAELVMVHGGGWRDSVPPGGCPELRLREDSTSPRTEIYPPLWGFLNPLEKRPPPLASGNPAAFGASSESSIGEIACPRRIEILECLDFWAWGTASEL